MDCYIAAACFTQWNMWSQLDFSFAKMQNKYFIAKYLEKNYRYIVKCQIKVALDSQHKE